MTNHRTRHLAALVVAAALVLATGCGGDDDEPPASAASATTGADTDEADADSDAPASSESPSEANTDASDESDSASDTDSPSGDTVDCSLVGPERVEEIFGLPVEAPPADEVLVFGQDLVCEYLHDSEEASRSFNLSVWPNEDFSLEGAFDPADWEALERVDVGDGGVIDADTNLTMEWQQDGRVFQITIVGFGEVEGTPDPEERKELVVALARDISADA